MNNSEYVLQRINNYFQRLSEEKHSMLLENVGSEYVSTSIELITKLLNVIKDKEKDFTGKRFLDIGSGIGNMCGVANNMGLKAEGIELNPVLHDIAKAVYSEIQFHNIDIRDFNNYSDYDIIFYYCPFVTIELQKELKQKIEDQAKIGAYIAMHSFDFEAIKDNRFINIYSNRSKEVHVWKKIGNNGYEKL